MVSIEKKVICNTHLIKFNSKYNNHVDSLKKKKPDDVDKGSSHDEDIPVVKNVEGRIYFTGHKRRGQAIIFNHYVFEDPQMKPRQGTFKDVDNLTKVLKRLDFEVKTFEDLKYGEIYETLRKGN